MQIAAAIARSPAVSDNVNPLTTFKCTDCCTKKRQGNKRIQISKREYSTSYILSIKQTWTWQKTILEDKIIHTIFCC
jgi:hypothetical protein